MTWQKKIVTVIAGLTLSSATLAAGNAANGQKLYTASQCNKCHGSEVYTSPDRKVKSLAALEAQVRRCDSNLNTNWFDDDINDVTAYLNQQYYKF